MYRKLLSTLFLAWFIFSANAQIDSTLWKKDQLLPIEKMLTNFVSEQVTTYPVRIDSIKTKIHHVDFYVSENLAYRSITSDDVQRIKSKIQNHLDSLDIKFEMNSFNLICNGYTLEELVPQFPLKKPHNSRPPLVKRLNSFSRPEKGLDNNHIALWQSHGWYYEQSLARWEWQRARTFQTVEDLYTQSYVLPFLVPMLEAAGANVLLPRERDTQKIELIIDNDGSKRFYKEKRKAGKKWKKGATPGFAHKHSYYVYGENPFSLGTFRQIKSTTSTKTAKAKWLINVPKNDEYAVYISYKSLPNSAEDARYTVYHAGGKTTFSVNQTMGGGTWIYLGTFKFLYGERYAVELSNYSQNPNRIITADAIKIGGGMGNIARKATPPRNPNPLKIEFINETSGYPRYTEAARYWLQWSGAPDSVYSVTKNTNDYIDDYKSRGLWVNWLAGGSKVLPQKDGLHIPIDLSFAFHSDAGTTFNDSIVGTLGICMTQHADSFPDGTKRIQSRYMTSFIMDQIVHDIRKKYEPKWSRRPIWNKSYFEARYPEVPSMLLELLSHQNFADMKYGLDPRFRFDVSRAIYKGMLRFIAANEGREYCVQPLPIHNFALHFNSANSVQLTWEATPDSLEKTATPDYYIVYTRTNNGGFDEGIRTDQTSLILPIKPNVHYSFKVVAANQGGKSFPGEILSCYQHPKAKGEVLIVNGFTRLSGPDTFESKDSIAGFYDAKDHGVPYIKEYHHIGSQYEFRREIPWMDDDAPGFGASRSDYETTVIAGNTFDYPYLHGISIAKAGYSYCSTSVSAFVKEYQLKKNNALLIDLILGKQKLTQIGRKHLKPEYKTFPIELQKTLKAYTEEGGNLFISGAYIASDFWDSPQPDSLGQVFAKNTLKIKWRSDQAAKKGQVKSVASPFQLSNFNCNFFQTLNETSYAVESPDAIEPSCEEATTFLRYSENNLSAGVLYLGSDYSCVTLGFPFESIEKQADRDLIMKTLLRHLENKE